MKRKTRTKAPDARDAEVGRRIRAQRLVCSMSQTELGQRVGITFQQIQKYEKGVNRVGAGRLAKIAEVLSVPVAFFFGGSDQPTQEETDSINSAPRALLAAAGANRASTRLRSRTRNSRNQRFLREDATDVQFFAFSTASAMKRGSANAARCTCGVQYRVANAPALAWRCAIVSSDNRRSAASSVAHPIAKCPPT